MLTIAFGLVLGYLFIVYGLPLVSKLLSSPMFWIGFIIVIVASYCLALALIATPVTQTYTHEIPPGTLTIDPTPTTLQVRSLTECERYNQMYGGGGC